MNCKPGDLAIVVRDGGIKELLGRVVRLTVTSPKKPTCWYYEGEPIAITGGAVTGIADSCLRPIRDQPGNEQWFRAAPKSLPATTKGDTIDARGCVKGPANV